MSDLPPEPAPPEPSLPEPAPPEPSLPPSLRLLKWLVIVLTLTMIGGVITIVGLIVTRMPQAFAKSPQLPENLALPAGVTARAVTFGTAWSAVVTMDDRILIFDSDGALTQSFVVRP